MTDPPAELVVDLYSSAKQGSRRSLGRLLTLVERGGAEADIIARLVHPDTGRAHIIGVTGAPGAGKSTLTGQLVRLLVEGGRNAAVLAVDPSSPLTGGAILGDRIRMDGAATHDPEPPSAFIRSMASRGHSGGLALAVPLAGRLFDSVGHDPVIIETVGVGQAEVEVVGAADTVIVVVAPGMGDAVQANKAGLLEVADVFVVNKADLPGAADVRRDLDLMLDLSHVTGQDGPHGYRPPIVMSNAIDGVGAGDVLAAASAHLAHLEATGLRDARRRRRIAAEVQARMSQTLGSMTASVLESEIGVRLLARVEEGSLPPAEAGAALLDELFARASASPSAPAEGTI